MKLPGGVPAIWRFTSPPTTRSTAWPLVRARERAGGFDMRQGGRSLLPETSPMAIPHPIPGRRQEVVVVPATWRWGWLLAGELPAGPLRAVLRKELLLACGAPWRLPPRRAGWPSAPRASRPLTRLIPPAARMRRHERGSPRTWMRVSVTLRPSSSAPTISVPPLPSPPYRGCSGTAIASPTPPRERARTSAGRLVGRCLQELRHPQTRSSGPRAPRTGRPRTRLGGDGVRVPESTTLVAIGAPSRVTRDATRARARAAASPRPSAPPPRDPASAHLVAERPSAFLRSSGPGSSAIHERSMLVSTGCSRNQAQHQERGLEERQMLARERPETRSICFPTNR